MFLALWTWSVYQKSCWVFARSTIVREDLSHQKSSKLFNWCYFFTWFWPAISAILDKLEHATMSRPNSSKHKTFRTFLNHASLIWCVHPRHLLRKAQVLVRGDSALLPAAATPGTLRNIHKSGHGNVGVIQLVRTSSLVWTWSKKRSKALLQAKGCKKIWHTEGHE